MTDAVTHSIITTDGASSLSILCFPQSNTFVFGSDLFLGVDSFGDIEYRFDDEKPSTARAFLSKTVAVTGAPVSMERAIKAGGDKFMIALNGWEFGVEMTTKPHRRLRVRLRSLDGSTKDLDFDISGAKEKMAALNATCQAKRNQHP